MLNPPIIGLTGHVGKDKHHECIKAGMNEVLTKPAPPLQLESTLKQFVWEKKESDDSTTETKTSQQSLTPAIDIEGCIRWMGIAAEDIEQMLDACAYELKQSNKQFKSAYKRNDTDELLEALRHCLSGTCYLRLPRLNPALKALQVVIKEHPHETGLIAATYCELQEAVTEFFKEYRFIKRKSD